MKTILRTLWPSIGTFVMLLTTVATQAQTLHEHSDIPRIFSYQGLLTSPNGSPVPDGSYNITVSLFSDSQGEQKIWSETQSTTVSGGLFNMHLGNGNIPLPDQSVLNRQVWVGIQIGDSPTMLPLTPLSASPYALNVANHAITNAKLSDGAVTAEKVDMDYIAAISVNGKVITGNGTTLNIESSEDIALDYNDQTHTIRLSKPAPAVRGDQDKATTILAGTDRVWSMNGDGWDVGGSASTTAGVNDWIGTSNNQTFASRTNNQTIMRYQPNGTNTPNIVGGHGSNSISTTSIGSVISGGGDASYPNSISSSSQFAVVAGGSANDVSGDYSSIGGGYDNTVSNFYAVVAGGHSQVGSGDHSFIGGGQRNTASATHSTVAGGYESTASNHFSTVGGGNQNQATGSYSTVAGGAGNTATVGYTAVTGGYVNAVQSQYSFIGGGETNTISHTIDGRSAIAGGRNNMVSSPYSFIGGGDTNIVSGSLSVIAGGQENNLSGDWGFVGSGFNNTASAVAPVIGGGFQNNISANYSSITGGQFNVGSGTHSHVGGGYSNTASGSHTAVVGGYQNSATGPYSAVGGGYNNSGSGQYSTISGGHNNSVVGNWGFVGGGYDNSSAHVYTTVGGGTANSATQIGATVGGGSQNTASGNHSSILGGQANQASQNWAAVGGGIFNYAVDMASFIGGGQYNNASGPYSAILGGDNLATQSYAQSAVGFHNALRGTILTSQPTTATIATNNDPLFMVGNGALNMGTPIPSNAFEVSYNGHSVVYDVNRTGQFAIPGSRAPIQGATYTDNLMYAWGDVGIFGAINSDFGVGAVAHPAAGVYIVTVRLEDPNGNPVVLNNAAITATLATTEGENPFACQGIRVSQMGIPGPNQFTVYTFNTNTCQGQNSAFMFHVTGRP